MAAADNNRRATIRGRNGRANERFTFAVRQPVGLAQNTEDRDAVDLEAQHELDESLPRFEVDAFVVMKGRGEDGMTPRNMVRSLRRSSTVRLVGKASGGR